MSTRVGVRNRLTGVAGLVWGAALLWRGRELFQLIQRHSPSAGAEVAITALGTRHLAQGLVQVAAPHHFARLEAVVDFLHAGSMIAVAVKEPTLRRAALTSGTVAGTSGVLSVLAARAYRKG
ncbi:MAG: hypothetical protein ACR2LI_13565 [Propionibacteriaceae bacterium]